MICLWHVFLFKKLYGTNNHFILLLVRRHIYRLGQGVGHVQKEREEDSIFRFFTRQIREIFHQTNT